MNKLSARHKQVVKNKMNFQTWKCWITRSNRRFPGLGVLPRPTNNIAGIMVEGTRLQPNLAGRLSADVFSNEGALFEIDFALCVQSLNSQIQQKPLI